MKFATSTRVARYFHFPFERINWTTSSFLIGTLALTLTAVPAYLWKFGFDRFQITLFVVMIDVFVMPPMFARPHEHGVLKCGSAED